MEEVRIDGIPIGDYGRPSARTVYPENYSLNYNFMQVGAMQGWQCPVCKRILAPFMIECPCGGQIKTTTTYVTSEKENK